MKKLVVLLTLFLTISLVPMTNLSATFRFEYDTRTTNFYQGVRHTELIGTLTYNDNDTLQKINYMAANPTTNEDILMMVGDNYQTYDWGKGDLATIINNINTRHDNYHVIGGVNGDFFGASGIPIEAYVYNFEVLSNGLDVNRTVVGFKDDGSVVFGSPCFEGYEVIVFNANGNIKHRFPLEGVNQLPQVSGAVSAYFPDYTGTITGNQNKVILGATNLKLDEYQRTYFGKGIYDSETTEPIEMEDYSLVLVGDTINSDDLITADDTVVIQDKMGCEFENVRYAVGGWSQLVDDGNAIDTFTEGAGYYVRHPRTAIGVKEDGTIFFITIDGRDYVNGYTGVTHYELAEIMVYFDAVEAYNLDGGGSTTMMVEQTEGEYVYLNTPSDGQPRAVTNGLFFVSGEHEPPPAELPYPDTRIPLDTPNNLQVTLDQQLSFDPVLDATSYDVNIDGSIVTIMEPTYQMNLSPGLHMIQVQANGNFTTLKDSEFSAQIVYVVYTEPMQDIIDFLKSMANKK